MDRTRFTTRIVLIFAVPVMLAACSDQDFAKLDKNGDGSITQEEAQANPSIAGSFRAMDGNSDGRVDSAEFAQFEEQSAPEAPEAAAQQGTVDGQTQ
ncbi:MAG: hypothetical protein PVF40_04255 [Ectothiorhodospiraceae bacterium]